MQSIKMAIMWLSALAAPHVPAQIFNSPQAAPTHQSAGTGGFSSCRENFVAGKPPSVPAAAAQRAREVCFNGFAVLHSGKTKTPIYSAEVLTRQRMLEAKNGKRTDVFYEEARLPSSDRAKLGDYRGSTYSRGHMSPAADMANPEAMAQSFSLSNIVPQHHINNSKAWADIEKATRRYVLRAQGSVYVFTGPAHIRGQCPFVKEAKEHLTNAGLSIPSDDADIVATAKLRGFNAPYRYDAYACTIGAGVAVPSHIFKLVYDASTNRAWGHWMENNAQTRVHPPLTYAELVKLTGIEFLPGVRPSN